MIQVKNVIVFKIKAAVLWLIHDPSIIIPMKHTDQRSSILKFKIKVKKNNNNKPNTRVTVYVHVLEASDTWKESHTRTRHNSRYASDVYLAIESRNVTIQRKRADDEDRLEKKGRKRRRSKTRVGVYIYERESLCMCEKAIAAAETHTG